MFSSSGTYTVPAGVSRIRVQCWGAGGGGSSVSGMILRGGGGGGGAYAANTLSVTPGETYSVTIGTGGAANTTGGSSIFGSNLVVAVGGNGATANSTIYASGGAASSCTGLVKYSGGNGSNGGTGTGNSGYGGGGAGSTGAGSGNTGKVLNGGNGGTAVTGLNNGNNGSNYGGGGSGAVSNTTSGNVTGGSGANGLVTVSYNEDICAYSENTNSGVTYTPNINYASIVEQTVSTGLSSHQYFLLNVIKGLTYSVYTRSTSLAYPIKMAVYQEGMSAASPIATSFSNNGNTDANANNVFLTFTSTFSGLAKVLLNDFLDCSNTSITGINAYMKVTGGYNCQDDSTAVGTDTWIGHIYDGINLDNYLGYYTQAETFREMFGSAGTWPAPGSDENSNFNFYSNGSIRGSVKVTTFSVRYRMFSTRKGLCTATLSSDDGHRLFVDGSLIYNNWNDHSPVIKRNVLIPFSGSSSLIMDYYEKTGQNIVGFDTLSTIIENKLTANTTQGVCLGDAGLTISGDEFGTLPTGITKSGTGYQWSYSSTLGGARTDISGATASTYLPSTSSSPFNAAGTYYLYRTTTLVSTNNVSPSSYTASIVSNAATLVVNPILNASVSIVASDNMLCDVSVPVTFTATPANGGSAPVYQWLVNGLAVGTNSSTYTYTPANNDIVNCMLTSNATPCLQGSPAVSNSIQMLIISSSIPVSVNIAASSNPVCSGNTVTYTASPVNGGTVPSYNWFVNGVSRSTAGATFTFTPANNDVISCILTSNIPGCVTGSPATSNSITQTVNPINTITLSSAAGTNAQTVCSNSAITAITYTTTSATGATFSGLPAGVTGSWASNKVTISGTPTVAGTYTYTVTLTGGYSCVTSATGTITVIALPSAPTTTGASLTCIGGSPTLVAHGASSGSKYKWYTASSGGTLLKTSTSNTDSTYVPTGITTTTNYYVSIINASNCEGSRTIVTVTMSVGASTDDQTTAGADTWIGHVYDGVSLNTYYGHYTESESFNELFGGNTNCFSITSGSESRSIYTETFSVRYRMNSTRRGLYTVTLGSDDGSRLYVDGNLIYNNWVAQSYTARTNVLMNLTGSSALIYDFFEQNGGNQITFNTINLILSNILSINTTQSICIGAIGNTISGDEFGTLPTGISLSGTGYQWYYSTSPSGTKTAISGATSATFEPNTATAPFNTAGTYYLFRYASVVGTNNVSPTSYTATNTSNAATITITSCTNYWRGNVSTDWGTAANWTANYVPTSGADVEYATATNNSGVAASNNLQLDKDRMIGDLTNATNYTTIIPAGLSLTVSNNIKPLGDTNPTKLLIKAASDKPNGTLIFHNSEAYPVYATVEMYSKASYDLTKANESDRYQWQYFGIPVQSLTASPTFDGAFVRSYNEAGTTTSNHWTTLTNNSVISPFYGYELCQKDPKTYTFSGKLVNSNFSSGTLNMSSNGLYKGQYVFANSYTAPIDIRQLTFGSDTQASVYVYNCGSFSSWYNETSQSDTAAISPGQYMASSLYTAGTNEVPRYISSMQGFVVTRLNTSSTVTFGINYSAVAAGYSMQKLKAESSEETTSTLISITSDSGKDKVWIITHPSSSSKYDWGWDANKKIGSALAPQLYAVGEDGNYQIDAVNSISNTILAFQAGSSTEYKLTFNHTNLSKYYSGLYLIDKVESKTIDITESGSEYNFMATSSPAACERFKLIASEYESNNADINEQIKIFSSNEAIYTHNKSSNTGMVWLYDIAGRLIKSASIPAYSISTVASNLPSGAYVLKYVSAKEEISKRVIVK